MKIKAGAWIGGLILFGSILFLGYTCYTEFESIILFICAIVLDLFLFMGFAIHTGKEKKEKFCSKCKKQFDFDEDIEYREINRYTRKFPGNESKQGKLRVESLTYKVAFTCTCSNCNTIKTFTQKLDGGAEYNDGTITLKDPEEAIESFFSYNGLSVNDPKSIAASFIVGILTIIASVAISVVNSMGLINSNFMEDIFGPSASSTLDASEYYGTYYAVSDEFTEYKLTISDRRVQFYSKSLMGNGGIQTFDDSEQVFYTADYMQKQFEDTDFLGCGALVLGDRYIFWITSDDGENSEFTITLTSGEWVEFTAVEKTLSSVTGDPKNYYGTYEYGSNNSIQLYKDSCNLFIEGNNSNGTWSYVYANSAILKKINVNGYSKGIIAYKNDSYVWFVFSGSDLLLKGEYRFTKDN